MTLYTAFDDKSQEMRGPFTSVALPNGAGSLPTTISLSAGKH